MENKLLEFAKRLLQYKSLTKADIIDELHFFINDERINKFLNELESEEQ